MTSNAGLTPTADATPMIAKIIGVFSARRPRSQVARNSIIIHCQQFVKRKVVQKLNNYFSRICATLPVDFWCGLWYTIIVKGRNTLGTQDFPIGLKQDFEVLEKNVKTP